MLRKWNVVLVVVSFLLAIFGTFITRSGVIESVHSFAQSPVGTVVRGVLLPARRASRSISSRTRLQDLEAKAELESMVSREAAFLYNNLVLVGIAFAVLWGTIFPIISEWVRGTKITVGPPFFNTVNIPLGLLLLALTGIGPLIAWRKASMSNLAPQFAAPGRRSALVVRGAARSRSACATSTRSSPTRSAASSPARSCRSSTRAFARGSRSTTSRIPIGVRAARRAQSSPLRRLHRARRHRDALRGVRRPGVQDGARHHAPDAARRSRPNDPYGHHWRFVSQGVSTSETLNRIVDGRRRSRRSATASRTGSSRRRSASTSTAQSSRSSSRSPKSASARRRSWTRTSCSPACATTTRRAARHVQSARRLGVDRRIR